MARPTLSIVIRTFNESRFLGRLLDVLGSQQGLWAPPEILVVDSGSTDGTREIARARGVKVMQIPKDQFDYANALNLGIMHCSGEILAFLSAHAIPCTPTWLSLMIRHFEDESVAGVYSRQVPWPGAYWREVVRLRKAFGPSPLMFRQSDQNRVPFSNAASCIRRSLWERHRFCLPTAEDTEWATWAVGNGYAIVYEPGAAVYHSHDDTCREAARRLIQFETAADMRMARRRGLSLTIKQSIGGMLRDARDISAYSGVSPGAVKLFVDSLVRSYWFIRDFRAVADDLRQRHKFETTLQPVHSSEA